MENKGTSQNRTGTVICVVANQQGNAAIEIDEAFERKSCKGFHEIL